MVENAENASKPSALDRFLKIFTEVRAGEGANALLMLVTIFLLLFSYYIIKVVREPLILEVPDGPKIKSYASAGQALVLMGFVPFYSWFSSKVDRKKLILSVGLFFIGCIQLFVLAVSADVKIIGIVFYIWVGIFSLSMIAQFWAFANDIYTKDEGSRLFPLIGIGATAGSPVGSYAAKLLFDAKLSVPVILEIASVLLAIHVALSLFVNARANTADEKAHKKKEEPLSKKGGFSLVFRSRYLVLMAVFFLLLNIVNTLGEYIVSASVNNALPEAMAAAGVAKDTPAGDAFGKQYFGSFYGSYFFIANIAAVIMQAFIVSRIVKITGIKGVVLLLPIVSLASYSMMAAFATFSVIRWAKTAENATDYSVMNTGRAMLWLPTSREEKYKAKQAIDTFFVRFGDVTAAGLVYVTTEVLTMNLRSIAGVNAVVVAVWLLITVLVLRENHKLGGSEKPAPEAAPSR
jgi:AAA family ATP:ADP antiporter